MSKIWSPVFPQSHPINSHGAKSIQFQYIAVPIAPGSSTMSVWERQHNIFATVSIIILLWIMEQIKFSLVMNKRYEWYICLICYLRQIIITYLSCLNIVLKITGYQSPRYVNGTSNFYEAHEISHSWKWLLHLPHSFRWFIFSLFFFSFLEKSYLNIVCHINFKKKTEIIAWSFILSCVSFVIQNILSVIHFLSWNSFLWFMLIFPLQ